MKSIATALLLVLLGVSCSKKKSPEVVLEIGDAKISLEEFSTRLIDEAKDYGAIHLLETDKLAFIKRKVLDDLIVEGLLFSWAKQNQMQIDKQTLDQLVQEKMAEYPDKSAFQQTYSKLKLQKEIWQKKLQATYIKDHLLKKFKTEPTVDDKKVKALYYANEKSFTEPEKILLQQIVVKNEMEATTISEALKKGSDFAKLARQYSQGAEAGEDGVVGWIEKGTLPIFDAAFKLPEKRISKPQKSSYGYHIFRVLEKKKRRKLPLAEVKEQLAQESVQEQQQKLYKKWLEDQLLTVKVKQDEELLKQLKLEVKGS